MELTLKKGGRSPNNTESNNTQQKNKKLWNWPWWWVVDHITIHNKRIRSYDTGWWRRDVVTMGKWWRREVVTKGSGDEGEWWRREVVEKGSGDEGMWLRWEVLRKGSGDEGKWWWRGVVTKGGGDDGKWWCSSWSCVRSSMRFLKLWLQIALSWLQNVAWAMFWGGSRSTKPCVFPCEVAAAGDERYLVCAAVAAGVVPDTIGSFYAFCNKWLFHVVPVCVVLCVSWSCGCRSHCNGCMNVAWAMFWGGSRSTKPCVFPCKVAAAGDERYLVCAAVAAGVVPDAIGSFYVFCNKWLFLCA